MRLVTVTATTDPTRAHACIASWGVAESDLIVVPNGTAPHVPYLGTVRAFAVGVDQALRTDAEIIANFHDDLRIDDPLWMGIVEDYFFEHPRCGLLGFGGALGLGDADLYQKPYSPHALARQGFRSNLDDAEAHGIRSLVPHQVACLDGFSQIGRREFFLGYHRQAIGVVHPEPVYDHLVDLGFVHHFYDGALACLAARLGWEVHYLPIPCHHYGGQTAVGDAGYQRWALRQIPDGDQGFWTLAHKIGYDTFVDVLPIRVASRPEDPRAQARDAEEIFLTVPED